MKVKNISKKVIGNQSFRLLPGGSMEVTGKECWVINNLACKRLEEVSETKPEPTAETTAKKSAQKTEKTVGK